MIKRILLFLLTNILVVTTLSIVSNLLGLHGYLTSYGIDYEALAAICLLWGMGASIISLLISRWMAKMAMRVKLIAPDSASGEERQLLNKVYSLARKAGLYTMPEVGIYQAQELNAFATGPTKNRALVAVSSGLLSAMNDDEVEGVLAHEITHITNGDMVTMTLVQGVINAFSMFLSRVIAYTIQTMSHRDSDRNGGHHSLLLYYGLAIFFDIFITLLGSMVVAAFSRYREYRADKGGAALAGRHKMIAALEHLRLVTLSHRQEPKESFVESLKISRPQNRLLSLLASHPDINLRIKALQV